MDKMAFIASSNFSLPDTGFPGLLILARFIMQIYTNRYIYCKTTCEQQMLKFIDDINQVN
jgi:hypothetical protein